MKQSRTYRLFFQLSDCIEIGRRFFNVLVVSNDETTNFFRFRHLWALHPSQIAAVTLVGTLALLGPQQGAAIHLRPEESWLAGR